MNVRHAALPGLELDLDRFQVMIHGQSAPRLPHREFLTLACLLQRGTSTTTIQELKSAAYPDLKLPGSIPDELIYTYVYRLRRYLSQLGLNPGAICNVRGMGYGMQVAEVHSTKKAKSLAREAAGIWSDHPDIKDSVEWVRNLREGMYRGSIEE